MSKKLTLVLGLSLFTFAAIQPVEAGLPPAQAQRLSSVQTQNNDVADAPFNVIQDGGFGMVRKGIYWSTVEATRGVYNFASSDAVVNRARSRNMFVSITLYGNNRLYEAYSSPGITTAAGRRGFAAFAAAMAARYRGAPVVFEIWNEPNLRSFWGGASNSNAIAVQYVNLVKEVAPAMRRADPNVYISAGSISTLWNGNPGSFQWFDECVRQGLLQTPIDAISQHPYGVSYPELILPAYATLRSKMDASSAGRALHITNTEVGYDREWIVERQKFTANEAEDVQGWMLARQNLVDRMAGMRYSNWYIFRDPNPKWPVVTSSLAPLPPYEASQVYSAQLNGYTYSRRITQSSANSYVAIFRNSAGREKAVVWTASPRTTASVRLATNATGSVRSVSVFGTARTIAVSGGTITIASSNAPQYIELGGSSATPTPSPSPTPVATPRPTPAPTPTPSTGLRNIALNRTPVVSSGSSTARFLTDGNTMSTNSRWLADTTYPQTITVNFASAQSISQLNYLQHSQRTAAYRIEVYRSNRWMTVYTRSSNTALNIQARFTPVVASGVRLVITEGSNAQKAYELQVMGGN